jgi:hypothetical protein
MPEAGRALGHRICAARPVTVTRCGPEAWLQETCPPDMSGWLAAITPTASAVPAHTAARQRKTGHAFGMAPAPRRR